MNKEKIREEVLNEVEKMDTIAFKGKEDYLMVKGIAKHRDIVIIDLAISKTAKAIKEKITDLRKNYKLNERLDEGDATLEQDGFLWALEKLEKEIEKMVR